ncbi:hypothetical protein CCH79_00002666 [Gambusia affinis]|uniref:PDZ domain-containing protein n=1 Tax=Gambusia affinis TaxID=33528 RepID=A0A315W5Y6_GAMAF|nr:hypothetical protein CCH79_00002666 [Gambusia affinis]
MCSQHVEKNTVLRAPKTKSLRMLGIKLKGMQNMAIIRSLMASDNRKVLVIVRMFLLNFEACLATTQLCKGYPPCLYPGGLEVPSNAPKKGKVLKAECQTEQEILKETLDLCALMGRSAALCCAFANRPAGSGQRKGEWMSNIDVMCYFAEAKEAVVQAHRCPHVANKQNNAKIWLMVVKRDMTTYKPRVISLTKTTGQTFGFYLRVEQNEEGHLIRCLEMGGPAELAGMKDGDRILRVNGTFVDGLSHSELVRNGGASVTFHILDESSYKQAKSLGVNLSDPQLTPVANGATKEPPKLKLCYLVKSTMGFGFSLRSVRGEPGLFMTQVDSGKTAYNAGVRNEDRLLEVNGENVENCTHDEVVEKIKLGGKSVMLLLVDKETDRFYRNKKNKTGSWLATVKFLPLQPRFINMIKESNGYGFMLRQEPGQKGKAKK